MDRFLSIDWHCPLEDVINTTFINGERLEKESVMHKIMTGNFIDPFKNIEEDYKNVELNLIKGIDLDIKQEIDNDNEIVKKEKECEHKDTQKVKPYVPGIVKPMFMFPKKSNLDKEQQAMCLRVLLRFSESGKPKITQAEREELQKYLDLQQTISQEQDEFLKFAKSKWAERSFEIKCDDFINLHWKSKLQHIYKLPRYYTEVTTIPFVTDKNIEVQFVSNCLQMGELREIMLPTLTKPYMLRINSKELQRKYFPKKKTFKKSSVSFKLPVSEDVNCEKLAEDNNVDLVISSSGLNCLLNNVGPKYSNSWILPLVIKKQNDKNVIYIDKPGPPVANTIPEKNTWVYKYILKYYLCGIKNFALKNDNNEEDNIFGDVHSEELLKIEEEYENISTKCNKEITSNVPEKNKNFEEISPQENIKNNDNFSANKEPTNKSFERAEDRISYNLFSIGPQPTEQNNLLKNIKEYRILVRTKTHGFETLDNKEKRLLLLTPKLEHQPDLGAEAVTLEEALKQWISLIFRPHTFLARVRISSNTSEILQIEYRTAMSIRNEIQRLYNMKVENSLVTLHNVIQSLTNLSPGRYLMRHTIRNGAFVTVSKPVENPGKNIFDMRTLYSEEFSTLFNSPWIMLDKTIPTPMFKCFGRMPAMFHPVNKSPFPNKKKFSNNGKVNKSKTSTTGIIRRSLRNKKKK